MITKIKNTLTKNLSNIPGWATKEKLVIFLADDWGSIRIPDRKTRAYLHSKGIDTSNERFNKYDTMASADDMNALFEVLQKHKDCNGKSASFSALSVMANPDFEKIKRDNYLIYHYEPFTATLERYFPSDDVFELWQQGIDAGIFEPQFHGREHLNVDFWLKGLREGDKNLRTAFDVEAIGPQATNDANYLAAFDFSSPNDITHLQDICTDGLNIFNNLLHYKASLFTSSALVHPEELEACFDDSEIRFIDRAKISYIPKGNHQYERQFLVLWIINSFPMPV